MPAQRAGHPNDVVVHLYGERDSFRSPRALWAQETNYMAGFFERFVGLGAGGTE